jgi:NAD(P)-dependent dehydrogenase (short-subunit alcohol dehydrogenase family)
MRLQGKVAIVTGASPNIGGAIASGFAAEGARVACNDLRVDVAEDRAKQIQAAGGDAFAIPGDVTDEGFADAAVQEVVDRWGGVDILVNNAVIFNTKGLLDMPVEEYRRQIDVILSGPFLFTRAVARVMIDRGTRGSIINLLSGAAWQGQPGNVGYSTGKSGLANFTRSVAMELAEHGIRVNGFTPTATAWEQDGALPGARPDGTRPPARFTMDFAGLIPLGRLPTPSDYVPALVYLASDESSMVTGTNISVDGGAQAKYWPWVPSHPSPH